MRPTSLLVRNDTSLHACIYLVRGVFREPDLVLTRESEKPVFLGLLLAEQQNENTPQLLITTFISDASAHSGVFWAVRIGEQLR